MHGVSRRQLLLGAAVVTSGLAGCTGGGEPAGGGDAGGAGPQTSTPTPAASGGAGTPTTDSGGGGSTPNDSPDPNCALLEGSPTPYDATGTPFVFTFDYVDSWELQDPLAGPGGRIQGISSPVVTVDGETESAGLTVGQKYEALTAAEVDERITDATSGDYARYVVAEEQEFGSETVQFLGFADADIPFYQTWLPHGDGEARFYQLQLMLNTSILRLDEDNVAQELCLEPTVAGIETVRGSLAPNPDSTIAEASEQ